MTPTLPPLRSGGEVSESRGAQVPEGEEKIELKPERCTRCGWTVWVYRVAGMKYVGDLQPLNAQEITAALVGGRETYALRLSPETGKPLRLDYGTARVLGELHHPDGSPPTFHGRHGCNALTEPLRAAQPAGGPGGRLDPPGPSAGRTAPFSGSTTPVDGYPFPPAVAPAAEPRLISHADPIPVDDIGELLQWAVWTDTETGI